MAWPLAGAICWLSIGGLIAAALAADDHPANDRESLGEFQVLVGSWRGVGQPKRGSTRDAWTERGACAWEFRDGAAALVFSIEGAKHYRLLRITPSDEPNTWRLSATRAESDAIDAFTGSKSPAGQIVFSAADEGALAAQLTLRTVADGDRLLVLLEQRNKQQLTRLAEIGYTRQGSNFGKGVTYRECIVTGGLGTIAVEHNGQTYYVCCGGCKELFEADPEAVIAEYKQRREQKQVDNK
ncbi:MAG: hypothetical protein K1X74_15675 [Pirellulales bacterium]|nr:hypothetical protein [Pirellulales bacterium]